MGLGQFNPQHGVGGGGWDLPELEMVCIRNFLIFLFNNATVLPVVGVAGTFS